MRHRLAGAEIVHEPRRPHGGLRKASPDGWVVTHRHDATGERPTSTSHFYRVTVPVTAPGRIDLPDDPRLVVLAASLSDGRCEELRAAMPLVERPDRPSLTVQADGRSFVDAMRVPLASPNAGCEITYALNGGAPQRYTGDPVIIDDTAVLTATATAPGFAQASTRTVAFTRVDAWPADTAAPAAGLQAGLKVRCYAGAWEQLPDFSTLKPTATLTGAAIALPPTMPEEDFGLQLEGWLVAPARGVYRLGLATDDGSRLWLDGKLVVDNDGLHGASEIWFDAPLDAGPHRLRLDYFQHLGGRDLYLKWVGPGVPLQMVPLEALRHKP